MQFIQATTLGGFWYKWGQLHFVRVIYGACIIVQIGETPLHIGAQCGFEEIVDILGEHGADPTLKNKVR